MERPPKYLASRWSAVDPKGISLARQVSNAIVSRIGRLSESIIGVKTRNPLGKVKVLMPFFGGFPDWFWLYLTTCRHNPCVEWHFFSEQAPQEERPPNVHHTCLTVPEFNELARQKLGVAVNFERAFKVCDFRPAFGVIFDDFLKDYDYWAWGDADLFFGDLQEGLSRIKFAERDIVSVRSEFLSGELTFLKNSEQVNQLYRHSRDWKKIFESKLGHDFEEAGHFKDRPIDSFTDVAVRAHVRDGLNLFLGDLGHNDRKNPPLTLKLRWKQGKLWDRNTGLPSLLYHFLDLKKDEGFEMPSKPFELSGGMDIDCHGIRPASDENPSRLRIIPAAEDYTRRWWRKKRAIRGLRKTALAKGQNP